MKEVTEVSKSVGCCARSKQSIPSQLLPTPPFSDLAVLGPLVLTADLLLLLWCEVVGNVKGFSDLLWRFSLDHVCDCLAANIKEGLDVEVVGSL